jgi:hypothetical protein
MITTLTAKQLMCKTYGRDSSSDYGRAYMVQGHQHQVHDLVDLYDLLEELESDPYRCVVRGRPIKPGTWVRRTYREESEPGFCRKSLTGSVWTSTGRSCPMRLTCTCLGCGWGATCLRLSIARASSSNGALALGSSLVSGRIYGVCSIGLCAIRAYAPGSRGWAGLMRGCISPCNHTTPRDRCLMASMIRCANGCLCGRGRARSCLMRSAGSSNGTGGRGED